MPFFCGDKKCDPSETKMNCPKDCGRRPTCGDKFCDSFESKFNCPQDCGVPYYCGDRKCDKEFGENVVNCFQDCKYCGDGFCNPEEEGLCLEDCERIKTG